MCWWICGWYGKHFADCERRNHRKSNESDPLKDAINRALEKNLLNPVVANLMLDSWNSVTVNSLIIANLFIDVLLSVMHQADSSEGPSIEERFQSHLSLIIGQVDAQRYLKVVSLQMFRLFDCLLHLITNHYIWYVMHS